MDSFAAVGIHEATYFHWLERGRAGESPYREFCEALTRAEQEAVVSLVDLVRSHAIEDWRAAAFLLERRHKKDWGRHETIDATVTSKLDEELERRLLKGRRGKGGGETRYGPPAGRQECHPPPGTWTRAGSRLRHAPVDTRPVNRHDRLANVVRGPEIFDRKTTRR